MAKKKSFDELMQEYNNTFGNPKKQRKILKQAAEIAKSEMEKILVNAHWLQWKRDNLL